MPWHTERGGGTCRIDQWAVIKDSDGSTAGCHATEEAAHEQMAALYAREGTMTETRADTGNITTPDSGDLNTAARKYAASRGWAMDDGSYPIRPLDMHGRADLQKATRAVGRGSGSHDAIRRHIIKRARALGLTDMIPENWSGGGSTRSAVLETYDNPPADDGVHYRVFSPHLEVRSSGDGRTIFGIAVPWDTPTRIPVDGGKTETFARGAFDHQLDAPNRVKLENEHVELGGTLIGAITMLRNDPAGLYFEGRPAKTAKGDETLELVKAGALDEVSVAFRERQNRRLGPNLVQRVKAHLKAIAITRQGVYPAAIAGVRSALYEAVDPVEDELAMAAEPYLQGLPELPDYETQIRAIRLGMPWR